MNNLCPTPSCASSARQHASARSTHGLTCQATLVHAIVPIQALFAGMATTRTSGVVTFAVLL